MKKVVIMFTMMLFSTYSLFAQETAKPLTDTEVVRKIAILDIEGKYYYDVIMTFKSKTPDYLITDKYKEK